MKKRVLTFVCIVTTLSAAFAQEPVWTMEACMRYAVENSPAVRKQQLSYDTYKTEETSAVANFFPSLEMSAGARYNFGRAIDPETNTYTNTTTFGNSYDLYASVPLFIGGQLINGWKLAKVNRQLGMNNIQKAKDDLALKVMQAYIDVVYYRGVMNYSQEKLELSRKNLHKISRQAELGLKGKADVAQVEAEVAGDDYLLTNQTNLYNSAMATLKEQMNYPIHEPLEVDTTTTSPHDYLLTGESVEAIFDQAVSYNPTARQADFDLQAGKLQHKIQKGRLLPSIYLSGGIGTSYFDNLKSENASPSFASQFKNNRGEYVSVSFSLPLFSRWNRVTEIRRARNNMRMAQETRDEVYRQLETAIDKAVMDREGYAKEAIQLEKKREAEEYSYHVTMRKFEEGLMSPLDLRTSANTLLEAKANLLRGRLMYLLKCKEVDYYKGLPLLPYETEK